MTTPPHDIDAETALLGAMLLQNSAVQAVCEAVVASDFYDTKHALIYDAILRLYNRGDVIDAVSVRNELRELGTLKLIGDETILVTYQSDCPSWGGAAKWGEIIIGHSLRRRLIGEGRELIEQAQNLAIDVEDVLETHQESMANMAVALIDKEPDDISVEEFMAQPRETINPWVVHGIIRRQHKLMLVGGEGAGKAISVDTPILTSRGWVTMGEVVVGDDVFHPSGHPTKVVAVTAPFMGPSYDVGFSDGSSVIAHKDHLWLTETLKSREKTAAELRRGPRLWDGRTQIHKRTEYPTVITTQEIHDTLLARNGHAANHSVEVAFPLQYPEVKLPISPYTFGAWLGDGTSCSADITCADEEIIEEIRSEGWVVKKHASNQYGWGISNGQWNDGLVARAKRLGVWNNKHIPTIYKTASFDQRLAVLQGLMDTDGTVGTGGDRSGRGNGMSPCEIILTRKVLAEDAYELILGLGIKATFRTGRAKIQGRDCGEKYRIVFQTDLPIFRLPRKVARMAPLRTKRAKLRYITSCESVGDQLVRCIQVDAGDGMFLIGRNLIPTHNSWILRFTAICAAYGIQPWRHERVRPVRTLIIDAENPMDALFESFETILKKATSYNPQGETVNRLWWKPQGVNLRNRADLAALENVIRVRRPDLVCMGPLYAMYENSAKDFGWETAAREVQVALKKLMVRYNFALMIEDHAPQPSGGAKRDMRPYGSSFWRRWPDIGIGMEADGQREDRFKLTRWRGDRVPTDWPKVIERGSATGSSWPFVGYWEGFDDARF